MNNREQDIYMYTEWKGVKLEGAAHDCKTGNSTEVQNREQHRGTKRGTTQRYKSGNNTQVENREKHTGANRSTYTKWKGVKKAKTHM